MGKKKRTVSIIIFICLIAVLITGIILTGTNGNEEEPIKTVMRDAVLHDWAQISLFGIINVNPGVISAFTVTAILFIFSLFVRIFIIPRFKKIPGKFQMLLEQAVSLFDGLAKSNSPHRNGFLGAYVFTAGTYIFIGTLFELFGFQAVTTSGHSISLPAPLSDINGAIANGTYVLCCDSLRRYCRKQASRCR